MRYREIIEASRDLNSRIADQRARVTDAYGDLQSKEAGATDARVAAQKLPLGAERTRRIQAASRREADARRRYNDTRMAANDRISNLMAETAPPKT